MSIVVGKAKVMSYDDIVEAQAKCDAKEVVVKGKRGPKQSEVEVAEDEIKVLGLGNYCSILQL